jgi:SMODS and SLOG-associating 2TM effector domain family 5
MEESQISLSELTNSFKRKLWITKGARYNAYRRLKTKGKLSLSAITWLSFYAISVSIVQIFPFFAAFSDNSRNIVILLSILFSISILVLSLMESSQNYQIRAENMHRCAREIAELCEELNVVLLSPDPVKITNDLQDIITRYHQILEKYEDNHEPIDNNLFRVTNSEFKMGHIMTLRTRVQAFIAPRLPYYIAIISLPLAIIFWLVFRY